MVTLNKFLIDQILWILENMDIIELYFIQFNNFFLNMSFFKFSILFQNRFEVAWQISLKERKYFISVPLKTEKFFKADTNPAMSFTRLFSKLAY